VRIAVDVLEVLNAAGRPLSTAELRGSVTGQDARIDHVVRLLVAAGRVRPVGRAGYVLARGGDDAA
jgi:hypothetical protein